MIELTAVRHGQSTANVAYPRADADGSELGLDGSDFEVELTPLGRSQSAAIGRWLAGRAQLPDVVVSSPYLRALETARLALAELPTVDRARIRMDERLRDRELGILEMMTRPAIRRQYPDEVARRERMHDFLYRPPGGESMADVTLRLRTFLSDAMRRYHGRRVLVVGHDATVLTLRLIIEELTAEQAHLAGPVLNGSITRWTGRDGWLELAEYNSVDHLGVGRWPDC